MDGLARRDRGCRTRCRVARHGVRQVHGAAIRLRHALLAGGDSYTRARARERGRGNGEPPPGCACGRHRRIGAALTNEAVLRPRPLDVRSKGFAEPTGRSLAMEVARDSRMVRDCRVSGTRAVRACAGSADPDESFGGRRPNVLASALATTGSPARACRWRPSVRRSRSRWGEKPVMRSSGLGS